MLRRLFRPSEADDLVVHSAEARFQTRRRLLQIINILLWCTGAAVIGTGVYVNINMATLNTLFDFVVFYSVNIVLVLSGTFIVIFSILGCCNVSWRFVLCLFSYNSMLVFFLQCIVAAISFTWLGEVEHHIPKHLAEFVSTGNDSSTHARVRFNALDRIQRNFQCCGADGPEDWMTSNWLTPPFLPYSCCPVDTNVGECTFDKGHEVNEKGCTQVVVDQYKIHFLIMGSVSVIVSIIQIFLFNALSSVIFNVDQRN